MLVSYNALFIIAPYISQITHYCWIIIYLVWVLTVSKSGGKKKITICLQWKTMYCLEHILLGYVILAFHCPWTILQQSKLQITLSKCKRILAHRHENKFWPEEGQMTSLQPPWKGRVYSVPMYTHFTFPLCQINLCFFEFFFEPVLNLPNSLIKWWV